MKGFRNVKGSYEAVGGGEVSAQKVKVIDGQLNDNKKILYKYTSMDFIESCIKNGIYASKIDAVNDPFESEGVKYPHLYRICCMTNSPKRMLLWAYYTNHKECCVEFDVSSVVPSLIRPVDYVDSFSPHINMSLEEVFSSLYRKGKEWKHENEFRAVYYTKNNDRSNWKADGDNVYLKATVRSVTFGLFSDRDLPRYKKALETLIYHGIEGKKCRLKNNKYALEDDRQFDLETELDRVNYLLQERYNSKSTLSISAIEIEILKKISDLQRDTLNWVSFETIITDLSLASAVQGLLDKGLLMSQYQKENNVIKFYYSLTDFGEKYVQHLEKQLNNNSYV